jgi:hypothetical protein
MIRPLGEVMKHRRALRIAMLLIAPVLLLPLLLPGGQRHLGIRRLHSRHMRHRLKTRRFGIL